VNTGSTIQINTNKISIKTSVTQDSKAKGANNCS